MKRSPFTKRGIDKSLFVIPKPWGRFPLEIRLSIVKLWIGSAISIF